MVGRSAASYLQGILLVALALLPSCVAELWRDYTAEPTVVRHELVDRQFVEQPGEVAVARPVLERGLWWAGADGVFRWRLAPAEGAEAAAALLADSELCEVTDLQIEATRRYSVDEVLFDGAQVAMQVDVRRDAVGHAVAEAELGPEARRVLSVPRRNGFVFAADPAAWLPSPFRECVDRLGSVDVGWFVGEPGDWHAESWVFVGSDGRPCLEGRSSPEPSLDPAAPLLQKLARLRGAELLVKARCGEDSRVLRVRPDRLWLLTGLSVEQGRHVHRSSWRLESPPRYRARRPDETAPRIASLLRLQQELYVPYEFEPFDLEFWKRVVWTPFALAADLVFGPPLVRFWYWITGRDPSELDPVQRRRR